MATAAYPTPRNLTKGYATIPNSLIENQALLTHGELSLALLVLRRGGNGATVSDRTWSAWTGLSPRLKEYAMKGLKEKGLKVEGRGDEARFTWQTDAWSRFIRTAPGSVPDKPRTAGRAVDPKPGAKCHPECRDKGCAMLRAECASGGLNLLSSTPVAQPVAQTSPESTPSYARNSSTHQSGLSLISATSVAQPVAQIWAQTLALLQSIFPLVGIAFLARLLTAVQVLFGNVTDQELAQAVSLAWQQSGRRQKSEGLFLVTVPEALAALRKAPKPARAPDIGQSAIRKLLDALEAEEAAPYRRAATAIRGLVDCENPETLESGLHAAEDNFAAAVIRFGLVDYDAVRQRAASLAEQRGPNMAAAQRMELMKLFERRIIFEDLKLPRFSVFA